MQNLSAPSPVAALRRTSLPIVGLSLDDDIGATLRVMVSRQASLDAVVGELRSELREARALIRELVERDRKREREDKTKVVTSLAVAAPVRRLRRASQSHGHGHETDDEGSDAELARSFTPSLSRSAASTSLTSIHSVSMSNLAPIETRYAHVPPHHLSAALGGTLAPELLAVLLNPASGLYHDAPSGGGITLVADERVSTSGRGVSFKAVPNKSGTDVVSKFTGQIPDIATFLVAWNALTALMCAGLSQHHEPLSASPETPSHMPRAAAATAGVALVRAMQEYAEWIADCATSHTWDSVARYHLRFCAPRFAPATGGAADPALWAFPADPRLTVLLRSIPTAYPVTVAVHRPLRRESLLGVGGGSGGSPRSPLAPRTNPPRRISVRSPQSS